MTTTKGLHADLCRSLSQCSVSPYFKFAAWTLLSEDEVSEAIRKNRPSFDEKYRVPDILKAAYQKLWDAAFEAYSMDKLPLETSEFLKLCDRSLEVKYEMFEGRVPDLTEQEQIDKVIEKMIDDGDIEIPDAEDDDEDED